MRLLHPILPALIFLATIAPAAHAGIAAPDPLLTQFDEGYGIVAVQVISAERIAPDAKPKSGWGTYAVKFHVIKLVAQTVGINPAIELKASDDFQMMIEVGLGNPVIPRDLNPFPKGTRFYLTIRPSYPKTTFEHAPGADAALRVADFDDHSDASYSRIRAVAQLPFDKRWNEVLTIAADAQADLEVRQHALSYLARYFVANGQPHEHYVRQAHDRLWTMWRGPAAAFSDDNLFQSLDYALQNFAGDEFAKSSERHQKWMDRIFAPPASGQAIDPAAIQRREELTHALREFAADNPAEIGKRLITELQTGNWPATFRNHLTGLLLRMQLESALPEPEWAPALQTSFSRLAVDLTDPSDFRSLAASLDDAATAQITDQEPAIRRHFQILESTQKLLAQRIPALKARAKPDDPDQSALAAWELEQVLAAQKSLDTKE